MNSRTVFCPSCGRTVQLEMTAVPLHGGHATLPDSPEAICLEFGDRCAAGACPVLRVRREVAAVRLARSGRRPDRFRRVVAVCQACDRRAEMTVVDADHAVCTLCGVTNRTAGDGAGAGA